MSIIKFRKVPELFPNRTVRTVCSYGTTICFTAIQRKALCSVHQRPHRPGLLTGCMDKQSKNIMSPLSASVMDKGIKINQNAFYAEPCVASESQTCGPSRSSKVVDFGTNRKHVCNFLLVINSNLSPILQRFRDIAGFLLKTATPPLFHPNFGVVLSMPTVLHAWCLVDCCIPVSDVAIVDNVCDLRQSSHLDCSSFSTKYIRPSGLLYWGSDGLEFIRGLPDSLRGPSHCSSSFRRNLKTVSLREVLVYRAH